MSETESGNPAAATSDIATGSLLAPEPTAEARLLYEELVRTMAAEGPMPVSQFMATALTHPRYGYYLTRDPLGRSGDFITAPDISQTFGEMLGLWLGVTWQAMGSPDRIRLVEMGPGRGTMMVDMLRAARMIPGFLDAIELNLIEAGTLLRGIQADRLERYEPMFYPTLGDLPDDGPALFVGNEFLDALPVRQFERHDGCWYERLVAPACDQDGTELPGRFCFVRGPRDDAALALIPEEWRQSGGDLFPDGAVLEICPQAMVIARSLGERIARHGGAALLIDYGYNGFLPSDLPPLGSLQAVHRHRSADPLVWPGMSDLTTHVNFTTMGRAATEGEPGKSIVAAGAVEQGDFLGALGIHQRAEILCRDKPEDKAERIRSGVHRLTSPEQMGSLFKAMALLPRNVSVPGFPSEARLF